MNLIKLETVLDAAMEVSIDGRVNDVDLITIERDGNGVDILDFVIRNVSMDNIERIKAKKIMSLKFFDNNWDQIPDTYIDKAELVHVREFGDDGLKNYRLEFYFAPQNPSPASKIKLGI